MRIKLAVGLFTFSLLLAILWVTTGAFSVSTPTQKRLAHLLHEGEVISMAFSPDSRYLVAGSKGTEEASKKFWHGRIKVWDTQKWRLVSSLDLPRWVQTISFSPTDPLLAVGSDSWNFHTDPTYKGYTPHPAEVRILSFPKLKEEQKFQLGTSVVKTVFSNDGKFFAVSFYDAVASIAVWSVRKWEKVRQFENSRCAKLPLARSLTDSSFLYVEKPADAFGLYRVAEVRCDKQEQAVETLATFDTSPAIDSISGTWNKRQIIYHLGGPLSIVNLVNSKKDPEDTPQPLFKATSPICNTYTVSEDGKWLACVVRRPSFSSMPHGHAWIVIWDLVKNEQLAQWPWPEGRLGLTSIAFSPDKSMLAVGTRKPHSTNGIQQRGEVIIYQIMNLLSR